MTFVIGMEIQSTTALMDFKGPIMFICYGRISIIIKFLKARMPSNYKILKKEFKKKKEKKIKKNKEM